MVLDSERLPYAEGMVFKVFSLGYPGSLLFSALLAINSYHHVVNIVCGYA
jgi:hypothetical protein